MALYSDKVMDHFMNPRNVGKLDNPSGVGQVGNARCGDIMKIYIQVEDGVITDVKFNTFGCASAIASSSMATELIKGKPIDQALALTNQVLSATGHAMLPIESAQLEQLVSTGLTVAAALISWWKNNSFTPEAIEADDYFCKLKEHK